MDILEQIQSLFDTYTNNEKKIAQFPGRSLTIVLAQSVFLKQH